MMRNLTTIFVLVGLAGSARADSPPTTAKDHFATAQRMFQVQQYDQAIVELQKAFVLDPKPEYLYAIAQAFRLAGDCTKAIRAYEQFQRTNPAKVEADKATTNIERCKAELAAKPITTPPPPAPVPVVQPMQPPMQPPEPPRRRGWTSDVTGHVLVGGGALLAVTGVILFANGGSTLDSINAAPTYDDYVQRRGDRDGAELRQRLGIAGMVAGGGLLIGGFVHYAISGRPETPFTTASIGSDHAMLVIAGAW